MYSASDAPTSVKLCKTYSYRDCQGKSKNYHWANLSHSVSRDVSDYTALCVSCHKLYDLRKIAL